MYCENKFCIYEKDNICILRKISLNCLGMCEDCIWVELDEDFLEREKERIAAGMVEGQSSLI